MAQLSKALFSSTKEDWATPQDFFDKLDEEFHFDLDPCADAEEVYEYGGMYVVPTMGDALPEKIDWSDK